MARTAMTLKARSPLAGQDGRGLIGDARDPTPEDGRPGDWWMNTDTKRLWGPKKANVWPDKGLTKGERGWGPIEAVVADGARRVKRIVDWVGGEGAKPPVGMYVSGTGYTTNIADATDVRGAPGPAMLVDALTPASAPASYDTQVATADPGEDNSKHSVQLLFAAGGNLPMPSIEVARNTRTEAAISSVTILTASDEDGGPGHIRYRQPSMPSAGPYHRSLDRFTSSGSVDPLNGGYWAPDLRTKAAGSLVPVPTAPDAGKELVPKGIGAYIMVPPRRIKLTEFGATGEVNPTVDTAAWNAALAEVDANVRGKIIELPTCKPGPTGGTWLGTSLQFASSSRNKTTVIGSGFAGPQSSNYSGGSRVVTNLSSGFLIVLGSALTPLTHFALVDFTIDNQGSPTAGANILVNNSAENDIRVEHRGGYHGTQVENAGNQAICRLHDSVYHDLAGVSMALGLIQPYFANGVSAKEGGSFGCRSAALFVRASGVQIESYESYQSTSHAWDFEPSGIGVQGIWLKATLADSANGDGYHFGSDGKCAEVQLVAPQASSCSGAGLLTASTTGLNGLTATGGIMSNNALDLDIYGGRNVNISALQAWYAATATLRVHPTMTGGLRVEGCQMGHGGWFEASGLASRTPNCVVVAVGADNYWITRNTMRGATVAAVADGNAASATRVSSGNYTF